jgi:hypothetical protein
MLCGAFYYAWCIACLVIGPLGVLAFGGFAVVNLFDSTVTPEESVWVLAGGAVVNAFFTYLGWRGLRSKPIQSARESYAQFLAALDRREKTSALR